MLSQIITFTKQSKLWRSEFVWVSIGLGQGLSGSASVRLSVGLGQCWYVSTFVWVSACVSVGMYQCLSGSVLVSLLVCINVCLGQHLLDC